MKKIIISSVCMIMALTMTGCASNNETQALENVNAQVNKVYSVVNSTGMNETSEVSPAGTYNDNTANNQLSSLRGRSYQNMIEEDYLRQEALELCNCLKDASANKYKLGKQNVAALKSLTVDLDKYATLLEETKPEVKDQVKAIKKHTQFKSLDMQQATSSYNSLNNVMTERRAYLDNLINTMNEIENILQNSQVEDGSNTKNITQNSNITDTNQINNSENVIDGENDITDDNSTNQDVNQENTNYSHRRFHRHNRWRKRNEQAQYYRPENQTQEQTTNTTENTKTKQRFKKNIDTYNNQINNNEVTNIEQPQNIVGNNNTNYINRPQPRVYGNGRRNNMQGYNQYGQYGNGYYGYNNWQYDGMPYRNQVTNPGRNTDTFYPYRRNIDTYRYNPNYNGYHPQNQYIAPAINANEQTNEVITENTNIDVKDNTSLDNITNHTLNNKAQEKIEQNQSKKAKENFANHTNQTSEINQANLKSMPKKVRYNANNMKNTINNTAPLSKAQKENQTNEKLNNQTPSTVESTTSAKKIENANRAIKHLIDNSKAKPTQENEQKNNDQLQDKVMPIETDEKQDKVMPIDNQLAMTAKQDKKERHIGTTKEVKFI